MFTNYDWSKAFEAFKDSISVMGMGMLGIFAVIGILCVAVFVLSKIPEKN